MNKMKAGNIFEVAFTFSSLLLVITIISNAILEIVPLGAPILLIFIVTILTISTWTSCIIMQSFISISIPLNYDLNKLKKKYPFIIFFEKIIPMKFCEKATITQKPHFKIIKEYDTNDLSIISTVIERKFVSSWYSPHISKEIGFPFACKELIDGMLNKLFQNLAYVDVVTLTSDLLTIYLKHFKEYTRALKRMNKAGKGSIVDHFKPAHIYLQPKMKNSSTSDHCLCISRLFLKELLPWELWETPQSDFLAFILSKIIDDFIMEKLSNPHWLVCNIMKCIDVNKKIVPDKKNNINLSQKQKQKENLEIASNPSDQLVNDQAATHLNNAEITKINDSIKVELEVQATSIESALSQLISKSTAPFLQRAAIHSAEISNLCNDNNMHVPKYSLNSSSAPVDIVSSKISPKKVRCASEVKIHDKLVGDSLKTWNTDIDLECISIGQDLLASFDDKTGLECHFGRLWEADTVEGNEGLTPNSLENPIDSKSPQPLWFGEEDNLETDLSEGSPPCLPQEPLNVRPVDHHSHSTNFSITNIHNIKDLQSTMNQAKHKIVDLQDEAAGMMEGILDLGRAGFRKGLKLTGLQESPEDSQSPTPRTGSCTSPSLEAVFSKIVSGSKILKGEQTKEPSAPIALVKQHRVTSQDSTLLSTSESASKDDLANLRVSESHPTSTSASLETGSPEIEYEEPEDFATAIAKLRSLLQQKSSDVTPNLSEDNSSLEMENQQLPFPGPNFQKVNTIQKNLDFKISQGLTHKGINQTKFKNTDKPKQLAQVVQVSAIKESKGKPDTVFSLIKPIDIATLADEYDDLPVHRAHIPAGPAAFPGGNNMQRLDRLFTRTVTGVFNSIKTVVGADLNSETSTGGILDNSTLGPQSQSTIPLQVGDFKKNVIIKDNWVFIEGDSDMGDALSQLLADRRGFCAVEAAQDTLETLTMSTEASHDCILPDDDFDDMDLLLNFPLFRVLVEIAACALGGPFMKHVVVKSVSVLTAEVAEVKLQSLLNEFTSWLSAAVFAAFKNGDNEENPDVTQISLESGVDNLRLIILENIPATAKLVIGEKKIDEAIHTLLSSLREPTLNRDLAMQILDVAALHLQKAGCLQRIPKNIPTPPPSA